MELMDHQIDASEKLSSGKILYGGTGSGKSATVLKYYYENERPRHIYVITTAKKRDSLDWEKEAAHFGISTDLFLEDDSYTRHNGILTIDSWNNIKNYEGIEDAFFVFDEQRVVGHGSWVKSFLKIAKRNHWVLLSATPGDTWLDYAPVFIANGFYRNITDFRIQHVLYEPFSRFPKVKGYLKENRLEMLRNEILVEMPYLKETERILNYLGVGYDQELFKRVYKDRWNIYEHRPVKDVAELFRLMRRVVNTDPSRLETIRFLMKAHPKLVIFYNFNYELDILRTLSDEVEVGEWNGHVKQPVPNSDRWVYLVQYQSGAEGWNCVETDAMVLYSMTYSYKNFEQSQGRIDRLDTKFRQLYYYILMSNSVIDRAVKHSLDTKQNFNERKFLMEVDKFGDVEAEYLMEYVEGCEI